MKELPKGRAIFKGAVSIGRNAIICTYAWRSGEILFDETGIELRVPWKKESLAWDGVSNIRVKYGISLYIDHHVPKVSPYLVFTPKAEDRVAISKIISERGFPVAFTNWF